MDLNGNNIMNKLLFKPAMGTVLAVTSGLSFFFLCMILPFVGPAGSRVDHALENKAAFLTVLVITFSQAALAAYSKLGCRKQQGGPLPWSSFGLCGVCVLTLVIVLFNGFAI